MGARKTKAEKRRERIRKDESLLAKIGQHRRLSAPLEPTERKVARAISGLDDLKTKLPRRVDLRRRLIENLDALRSKAAAEQHAGLIAEKAAVIADLVGCIVAVTKARGEGAEI